MTGPAVIGQWGGFSSFGMVIAALLAWLHARPAVSAECCLRFAGRARCWPVVTVSSETEKETYGDGGIYIENNYGHPYATAGHIKCGIT